MRLFYLLAAMLLSAESAVVAAPPNVVMILIDDLRWDELGCIGHPYVKTPHVDRLAREGVMFRNAFTVAPLCSPSRASFLTSQYPQTHGIVDNVDRSPLSHQLVTWPRVLHDAGYETGWVGKWHMGVDDSPRPGFDDWLSVRGQGRYVDPLLNDNGRSVPGSGYVTDIFSERAAAFISKERTKPFCLYLSHKAVHPDLEQRADGSIVNALATNFVPAERHAKLYEGVTIPRRPNCEDSLEGKPALQRTVEGLPPLGKETATRDHEILGRQRMFAAVDEGIGRILAALDETKQAENTIVVFTSDHGYFYGEHGLSFERRLAYEEAIRIPLIIRYPAMQLPTDRPERSTAPSSALDPARFEITGPKRNPRVDLETVLSIDVGPTILDLCGEKYPHGVAGRSFAPLLRFEELAPRGPFLVQHASDNVFARMKTMGYDAVRGERYKFIRYREHPGLEELYDLQSDPYELKNLAADPAVQEIRSALEDALNRLTRSRP